jgi:uncharacterized protein
MSVLNKKIQLALAIIIAAILIPAMASAKTYHITLLTVGDSEDGDTLIGGIADAYLEIQPGSGRIFLDSFPLTKLDTQISTRYANRIACDYLEKNCDKYDFFYTIRAESVIVGGPSASAPLTVLTIAALKGIELKNDTVMTGTINSGGSIGPVGGVYAKAEAAQETGFKRILIPKFSIDLEESKDSLNESGNPIITNIRITTSNNKTNSTDSRINISQKENEPKDLLQHNLTIEIVNVSNLEEALPYFIGDSVRKNDGEIIVPEEYTETMKKISSQLCSRAESMKEDIVLNESEKNKSLDFDNKINSSMTEKNHYSAASYCFNQGVFLRKIKMRAIEEKNPDQLEEIRMKAIEAVAEFDDNLERRQLKTLSELEAYIIVKERIIESEKILKELASNLSADDLAYAIERYYSAVYWSEFFNMKGKPVQLDQEYLEEACYKKISEAEERINYADLYLPTILQASRADINDAYNYQKSRNYKMCLFKASFAKAEANLLLSSLSIKEGRISELASDKLKSAQKLISKEQKRGFFPIMGYSYYEYADTLNKDGDDVSGLIFSEYSLELSNLEMYFPKKEPLQVQIDYDLALLTLSTLVLGMTIGALLMLHYLKGLAKKSRPKKKTKS